MWLAVALPIRALSVASLPWALYAVLLTPRAIFCISYVRFPFGCLPHPPVAWYVVAAQSVQTDECRRMEQLLLTLSAAHVFVKFVKCKAGDALKNYPDSQCPTLLIYKGGTVLKQFIKFDSFGGPKATAEGTCPASPFCVILPSYSCLSHVGMGLGSCHATSWHATSCDQQCHFRYRWICPDLVVFFLPRVFLRPYPCPLSPVLGRTLCSNLWTLWFAFLWVQTLNGSCPS